jgi:hypothetical protein
MDSFLRSSLNWVSGDSKLFLLERFVKAFMNEDITLFNSQFNLFMFEDCISDMKEIKYIVGEYSPLYSSLCNQIVVCTQNKIIQHLNKMIKVFPPERKHNFYDSFANPINDIAQSANEAMYLLGKLKMDYLVRNKYEENLEALKLFSKKLILIRGSMNYDEWLLWQLQNEEKELEQTTNTVFFESEIEKEVKILRNLKKWRPFRGKFDKLKQINEQEEIITQLKIKSENEKKIKIHEIQNNINKLMNRIEKIKL